MDFIQLFLNFQAVRNTVIRANEAYNQFIRSNAGQNFHGEIFVVGDYLGGILLHECLKRPENQQQQQHRAHRIVSRHSSSISVNSHIIPEDSEPEVILAKILCYACGDTSPRAFRSPTFRT